jgi:hypothetical protein
VVLGQLTEIDLQFKDVRPVKEAPPNLASDPFNLLQRQRNQNAEQGAQRSIPRTVLGWDLGQLSRKSDGGASDSDGPGVSGRDSESDSEGGADLSERVRGVPLRSGVEIVVKKGPFKGCTGHITDVLMEDGVVSDVTGLTKRRSTCQIKSEVGSWCEMSPLVHSCLNIRRLHLSGAYGRIRIHDHRGGALLPQTDVSVSGRVVLWPCSI